MTSFAEALTSNQCCDTTTQNGALSYSTTNSDRVNLFFKLSRDILKNDKWYEWIDKSWKENELDTMKILFNSRDCRGGKGDRDPFISAMTSYIIPLYPEWFIQNFHLIPKYGRWLDLIEIVSYYSKEDMYKPVIEFIVQQIKTDLEDMKNNKGVSLLAKWLPTEGKKWDGMSKGYIIKQICSKLYETPIENINNYHKAKYRKEVLIPLRNRIKLVEKLMCEGKWDEIQYSNVPSCAMKLYKNAFKKHNIEGFMKWLHDVKNGKEHINAKQLYPHEIVKEYMTHNINNDDVLEEQWKVIVSEAEKLGAFKNSIVLSDVSSSMYGEPMQVSIALGILISSLTSEPFKNQVITFSTLPKFHVLPEETLKSKVLSLQSAEWGGNTNFINVFKLILTKAQKYNLDEKAMPKRLYVLSDMQFDEAFTVRNFESTYETVERMYSEAGYKVPEMVFWNLRSNNTHDFPVKFDMKNVATISGYSISIIKHLLKDEIVTPEKIMRDTIDDQRYSDITAPTALNM